MTLNATYRKFTTYRAFRKEEIEKQQYIKSNTTATTKGIMLKEIGEEIDLTDITSNNSPPTLISITLKPGEKSVDNSKQGYARIHKNSDWQIKQQLASQIVPPINPGVYGGHPH